MEVPLCHSDCIALSATESFTWYLFTLQNSVPLTPKTVLARAVANGIIESSCLGEECITPQKQISTKRKTRKAKINALHQGIPLSSIDKTVVRK